jgi:hypothetical protein
MGVRREVRATEGTASDAVALRHPLFWLALAVLVVNDHVLKGAGVLPGWLTGKLSDFAGLLVAPVLGAALIRARSPRARAITFALVAGGFAAVKLVPAAARLSVELAGLVGLDWSFAPDPTDLVAFAILPLAWHVAAHRGPHAPRVWTERLALGLGVAACIASPPPRAGWTTRAYVVNRTGGPIEVRVRWVDARIDCAALRTRFADVLPRDVFSAGTLYALQPSEVLPLDRGLTSRTNRWDTTPDPTGHLGTCDVALISVEGLPDAMVYWDGLEQSWVPELDVDGEATDGLTLRRDGSELVLDAAPGYTLAPPLDVREDDPDCRDDEARGFEWSEIPDLDAMARIVDVRVGIDGCLALELEVQGETLRPFLCIPAVDFPFVAGNEVRFESSPGRLRITRSILTDGLSWNVGELVVSRSTSGYWEEGPFALRVVQSDETCEGVRLACGGFHVPSAAGIELADGTRFVHAGEAVERDLGTRTARLRVGRAETTWVTRDECVGRDVLGGRIDALVVYGEDRR